MIFDCFIYSNETECFYIRVAELSGMDVKHIVVQANKTFTNKEKPITTIDYPNVITVNVTDMPDGDDPWARERWQRNCIMRGLEKAGAKDSDLVAISDADEIIKANVFERYDPSMQVAAIVMNKYGYWLNCMEGEQSWKIAKILTYGKLKESTPDLIRNSGQQSFIEHGGHHFSYLGNKETIVNKLESFSHTECNTEELKAKLDHKIATGQSLWSDDPNDLWPFVKIDDTFPKYVVKHQNDSLKHLIHD